MKSIQRRFEVFKAKNPSLGDFTNLMRTVKGQRFSKDTIARWFERLVDKEDYSKSDKRHLIQELLRLTNMSEGNDI